MKSAIVLGAGIVGVATALHLQQRGWSVALVDRRGPGEETSHGNAGIIQSESVQPYPMPRDSLSLTKIALGLTNDIRYKLSALPQHALPIAQYWWNSDPRRYAAIADAYASLISQAVPEHEPLIRAAGLDNLVRRDGFLLLHRRQDQFDEALAKAKHIGERYGVPYKVLDPFGIRVLEPQVGGRFLGGIHWTGPWTVSNPGQLVKGYADLFQRQGGSILRGDAKSLRATGSGWTVMTEAGPIEAPIAVVALGPWSPEVLKPLGYRISMVRKRGYHRHFAGGSPLSRPVFDAANGYVLAPMQRGLRITTGAEFTGYDAPPTPVQLERAETAAREFIDLGTSVDPEPWFGTRPFLPGMLPRVGSAPRHPGLWFNFGHGHQGFTMGPASGRLIAELITGETPYVDPSPFAPTSR